jgi:Ca2+-binding EF-hand superfamily protein
MLGIETERRLKTFLEEVREGEMAQERMRQRLCSIRDFAPFSAFMRLDRDANENITSFEILNFLRDNREYSVTESDCRNLVKFFDADNDGRLSF